MVYYWPFQRDSSVVVYSNCQCSFAFCLSLVCKSVCLGWPCGHLLRVGGAILLCCLCFDAVLVVGVPFPLVFGTGCGIRLIVAAVSTLDV